MVEMFWFASQLSNRPWPSLANSVGFLLFINSFYLCVCVCAEYKQRYPDSIS